MKMELISALKLLDVYISQHYADKDILIIYQDDIVSREEYDALLNDLEEIGFAPPQVMRGEDFLIIEMPALWAKPLIDKHRSGYIRLEFRMNDKVVYHNHEEARDSE